MTESPFKMPYAEFRRRTPRVYGQPRDPLDPDGEIEPATATAVVEHREPDPNPYTIEGLIAGIGKMSTSAAHGDVRARRATRLMMCIYLAPFVVAGMAALIVRLHG